MKTLFERLDERGKSWRHVSKVFHIHLISLFLLTISQALTIVDRLLHTNSERALSCCLSHISVFENLCKFTYVDANGVDQGSEIRPKASAILYFLQNSQDPDLKRRPRPTLKTVKSTPVLSNMGTKMPARKPSLLDQTLIDVDVGSGTGSIDMDFGATVDMVFGGMSRTSPIGHSQGLSQTETDENSGRRGEQGGSEASRSRGSSTAVFDPEVILIIDHRGLGFCAREGEICEEAEEAWVSQLEAEEESEQRGGGNQREEEGSWKSSEPSSRRLSNNSFQSIQSFDSSSRNSHSSWFA